MNRFILWLTSPRRGRVVLGDFALVASVLVLGSVVGLVLVRNALLGEEGPGYTSPAPSPIVVPANAR